MSLLPIASNRFCATTIGPYALGGLNAGAENSHPNSSRPSFDFAVITQSVRRTLPEDWRQKYSGGVLWSVGAYQQQQVIEEKCHNRHPTGLSIISLVGWVTLDGDSCRLGDRYIRHHSNRPIRAANELLAHMGKLCQKMAILEAVPPKSFSRIVEKTRIQKVAEGQSNATEPKVSGSNPDRCIEQKTCRLLGKVDLPNVGNAASF